MANIIASGVISDVPNGSNVNYTIALSNSSSSNAAIGTSWYSWAQSGQDYLATNPIAVTPPTGWADSITHSTQYNASDSDSDSDADADTDHDAATHSYHDADADAHPIANPTLPVTPVPASPPTSAVAITGFGIVENNKHKVTGIVVDFGSARITAMAADDVASYLLTAAVKTGPSRAKTPYTSSSGFLGHRAGGRHARKHPDARARRRVFLPLKRSADRASYSSPTRLTAIGERR